MILRLLCVANGLLLQGKPWLITYFCALYCARYLFSMQPRFECGRKSCSNPNENPLPSGQNAAILNNYLSSDITPPNLSTLKIAKTYMNQTGKKANVSQLESVGDTVILV